MEHLTQLWDARFARLDAHLEVMKRIQDQHPTDQTDDKEEDQDDD